MTLRALGIGTAIAVAAMLGAGDNASACCMAEFDVPKPHHYVDTANQANAGNTARRSSRRADTQNGVTFKRRKGTPAPKRETELLIMVTPRLTTPTN